MEKISGILPATTRITAVDLRNSGTARSGTPGFGREVGVSTVAAKNAAIETAAKAGLTHKDQINLRNVKSDPKAEIVQKMADSFFINNVMSGDKVDVVENKMNAGSANRVDEEADQELAAVDYNVDLSKSSDDDLVVGQHLDVHA